MSNGIAPYIHTLPTLKGPKDRGTPIVKDLRAEKDRKDRKDRCDRGLRIDIIEGMGRIGGFGGLLVGFETLAQKNLASDYVN